LKMVFDQGMETTTLRVTWSGVPIGEEEVTKRNFREYYVNHIKYVSLPFNMDSDNCWIPKIAFSRTTTYDLVCGESFCCCCCWNSTNRCGVKVDIWLWSCSLRNPCKAFVNEGFWRWCCMRSLIQRGILYFAKRC
jgi:hypothetical protein